MSVRASNADLPRPLYLPDLTKDVKVSAATALRIFQTTENPQQQRGIPEDLGAQLAAFLPAIASPTYGSDLLLVTPQPGDGGALTPAFERLPTRPWEWNEQIEALAPAPSHRESFLPLQPVRNTASLSFALFQAEGSRERLPAPSTSAWFPPPASASSATEQTAISSTDGGWVAISSEQTYTDELESLSFARDHFSSLTVVAQAALDGPLPTQRASSTSGPSVSKAPTPTPSAAGPAAAKASTKPAKPIKRKASMSLASAPPGQRLKGSSAADAVVLDGADQVPEPATSSRKAGKTVAAKPAAGSQAKGAGLKKRKNSAA